jgi:hypothetical protein
MRRVGSDRHSGYRQGLNERDRLATGGRDLLAGGSPALAMREERRADDTVFFSICATP